MTFFDDDIRIYKHIAVPFIFFRSGRKMIVMTEDGKTYLMILSPDGLLRFPTSNPLIFGDYDADKCLKVTGVDMI